MKTYPIQPSFEFGQVSWKFYSRSDLGIHGRGLDLCSNMITDPRGPVESRGSFNSLVSISGQTNAQLIDFPYKKDEVYAIVLYNLKLDVVNIDTGAIVASLTSPYITSEIGDIHTEQQDGNKVMYFAHPDHVPYELIYDGVSSWTFQFIDFTSANLIKDGDFFGFPPDVWIHATEWFLFFGKATCNGTQTADSLLQQNDVFANIGDIVKVTFTISNYSAGNITPNAGVAGAGTTRNANGTYEEEITVVGDLNFNLTADLNFIGEITDVIITFDTKPSEWAVNNYPSTVVFGQGRSWWGGCPDDPQTLFASRSYTVAGYDDMTTGSLATDGFKFNLSKRGKVEWINNAKNIQVGTDNAEHILTSAGLVIKTGDISHAEQSGYGSKPIKPVTLGLETLYLSPDGKKIRSMWFTEEEDYVSQDITYTADGEFPASIKKFILAKKPDMIIWCVLEDGTFTSCTYFKEATDSPVIGWHFHSMTDGLVKDLVAIEKGSESVLIAAVHRNISGTDYIMIEKYNPDTLLDARETEIHGSPADTITGHINLALKTVQILADGAVHPDITLDASGDGVINYDASLIEMGFAFEQEIKTMPYISQSNQGTNASWKKRPNKIVVRLYNSSYPLINGQRPPDRSSDDYMDTPVPLFTGDVSISNTGYDEFGQISITQNLPLKLRITAILGEMTQSSL